MSLQPNRPRRFRPVRNPADRWSRAAEPLSPNRDRPALFSLSDLGQRRSSPSVLLIDEDDFGRETFAQILEADGYRVLHASNGHEALRQLRTAPQPGLIVLDLLLPRLNGWEFIGRLQRQPQFAPVPLIIVSATTASCENEFPWVVARFEKPVAVDELRVAIRQYLPL
jgi:CheY-like chemotaxis protein